LQRPLCPGPEPDCGALRRPPQCALCAARRAKDRGIEALAEELDAQVDVRCVDEPAGLQLDLGETLAIHGEHGLIIGSLSHVGVVTRQHAGAGDRVHVEDVEDLVERLDRKLFLGERARERRHRAERVSERTLSHELEQLPARANYGVT